MFDQTRQWRGVASAPWADRATDAGKDIGGTDGAAARPAWRSARRVGLRLATLITVALLCALSGTAVFDGRAEPLNGPAPVVWLSPGQGLAPWLVP